MRSRSLELFQEGQSRTARYGYSWRTSDGPYPAESLWSILRRLLCRNAWTAGMLGLAVNGGERKRIPLVGLDLRSVSSELLLRIERTIGCFDLLEKSTLRGIFGIEDLGSLDGVSTGRLRYCHKCIQMGYHSVLHQCYLFSHCPIHADTRLVTSCTNCGNNYKFAILGSRSLRACESCAPQVFDKNCELSRPLDSEIFKPVREIVWQVQDLERSYIRLDYSSFVLPLSLARQQMKSSSFAPNLLLYMRAAAGQRDAHAFCDGEVEMGKVVIQQPWKSKCVDAGRQEHIDRWTLAPSFVASTYKAIGRRILSRLAVSDRQAVERICRENWMDIQGQTHIRDAGEGAYAYVNWRMFWEEEYTPSKILRREQRRKSGWEDLAYAKYFERFRLALPENLKDFDQGLVPARVFAQACMGVYWFFETYYRKVEVGSPVPWPVFLPARDSAPLYLFLRDSDLGIKLFWFRKLGLRNSKRYGQP